LVTGAAAGIGKAIAERLRAEGLEVTTLDRAPGCDLQIDLASDELPDLSGIDVCVANAAITDTIAPAHRMTAEQWARDIDVNLTGAFRTVQACLPAMRARGYGRIVLTSSITGPVTGQRGFAHYGASKAAMLGFMRSAAVELARSGITVNAVMPGNVSTPGFADTSDEHQERMLSSIPMGRYAEPEEVGWAVRFLASPEAAYITGQTLIVDGGQVLPEAPG